MDVDCEIMEQPPQPALVIRLRTRARDLPRRLDESYTAIWAYLRGLSEEPAGPPFAAYYNMDMEDLDVAIGVPVARELPGDGDILAAEIPGGKHATCVFAGPYTEMAPAYDALSRFVAAQGETASGVAYEFYLTDPDEVPLEEAVTRIDYPLL